jgi:serine phosphatase RsbU (regulator of sigma subunit)/anti-sigma regulatory factor (Ser/Thr protein kinase)
VDLRPPSPSGPTGTDPVVAAALQRLRQQYGALAAELVDAATLVIAENTVRVPLGGSADLLVVLTFADAGLVDPEEVRAAAAQVSLALDYAALLDTERRGRGAAQAAATRLGLLQSLTAALAGALTAESIVTTVVSFGLEAFDAIAGALWVAAGDRLRLVGATDYPPAVLARWQDTPLSSVQPVPTAARERRTVLVHSLEQRDQDFPALRRQPSVGVAFAAVPLLLQDELIGAFGASFAKTDFISDPANLTFFEAVAGQCAVALHRVAVLDGERQARRLEAAAVQRLGRLRAVTARLSQPLSAASVADIVVGEMIAELGTERGMLFVLSPDFTRLDLVGTRGVEGASSEGPSSYPADFTFPGGEAVLTRRAVFLRNTTERNRRFPAMTELPPYEEQAVACVPLLVDGQPIGLLAVTFPGERDFQEEDTFFLQALADQCAQALDRTRLRDAQQRSRRQLALLAETGRLFATSLNLDATLEHVCRLLVPAAADAAVARVLEPGGRIRVVAVSQAEGNRLGDIGGADGEEREAADHLRRVIDQGETRLVVSPADDDEFLPGVGRLRALGLSSVAFLPLRARGRSLGLITAATGADRAPMTTDDVPFLSELASRVALAVDNARLFHHQTEIAHTLQRSLLPAELPAIDGAEVAVTYLPGTEGTTVGGDFYDVIPLPSGRFGLVIGDVMGRGVRAAAAMGQLRAAIRAYALEGHPPADLLARLDRLVSSLEEGLLVTCVYAEWDPGRRLIRLANAGHPPPLLRMPGADAVFLELDPGMPLGVGNIDCVDLELELPPGAMLLAYTDGLVESPDLALGDGMESLRLAVGRAGQRASAVCDSAVSGLRALQLAERTAAADGPPRRRHDDDIALLAMVVTGVEAVDAAPSLPDSAVELELPAEAASAGRARQFVDEAFGRWGLADVGDRLDTAVLLVSELVTNAVRHAGTVLRLRVLRPVPGRIRIEVIDHAPHGSLDSRLSGEAAEGGRGLYLVETLADAWGSAALGGAAGGKTIWFELDGVA